MEEFDVEGLDQESIEKTGTRPLYLENSTPLRTFQSTLSSAKIPVRMSRKRLASQSRTGRDKG